MTLCCNTITTKAKIISIIISATIIVSIIFIISLTTSTNYSSTTAISSTTSKISTTAISSTTNTLSTTAISSTTSIPSTTSITTIPITTRTTLTTRSTTSITWTTPTESPDLDQVIFITGGWKTEKSTEILDVSGGCSRITSPLPLEREQHISLYLPSTGVILCGCSWGHSADKCINSFSPDLGNWANHSFTKDRRYSFSSAVVGDKPVLVAGYGDDALNTFEVFEDDAWSYATLPPYNISGGSCSVDVGNDTLIVTGGDEGGKKVYSYNLSSGLWTQLEDMKHSRYYHGCGILANQLVVSGGMDSQGKALKATSCLDLENFGNGWNYGGDLGIARHGCVMVITGNRLLILGGLDDSYQRTDSVEEFGVDGLLIWTSVSITMAEKRHEFSAVAVPRSLVC